MTSLNSYLQSLNSDNYKRIVSRVWQDWILFIGGAEPSHELACEYLNNRRAMGKSNNTMRTDINTLRAACKYIYRDKPNPFRDVCVPIRLAQPTKQADYIPEDGVRRMLRLAESTSPHIHILASLMFYAGLRISEAVNLRWHNVILDAPVPFIVLTNTKAHKVRKQAISDDLAKILRKEYRLDGKVFPFNLRTANRMFKFLIDNSSLPKGNYSPHSARVTAISKLIKDGHSPSQVQEFSRHASIKMVEEYDRRMRSLEENVGRTIKY